MIRREQYLIAQSLINAIRACDSAFSAGGNEKEFSYQELDEVAEEVVRDVSKFQIENAMVFLDRIESIKAERHETRT